MAAWIYANGEFFKVAQGVTLDVQPAPGSIVKVLNPNGDVIGAVAATATSFVVISDEMPELENAA